MKAKDKLRVSWLKATLHAFKVLRQRGYDTSTIKVEICPRIDNDKFVSQRRDQ